MRIQSREGGAMSKLRPTLGTARNEPCPDTFDSLWMIRDSVERRTGLIHGRLHSASGSCAIGAYFDDNPNTALKTAIVDEVAAYNDSIPKTVTMRERRNRVLRWLTARIEYMRGRK
jgi:hypothetical protein